MPSARNAIASLPVRLTELRERAGLSRAALALIARTSESAVAMLERGERSPSLELAWRLARALQCPIDALVEMPGRKAAKKTWKILPTSVDSTAD